MNTTTLPNQEFSKRIYQFKTHLKAMAQVIRVNNKIDRQNQSTRDKDSWAHRADKKYLYSKERAELIKSLPKSSWASASPYDFRLKHIAYCLLRGKKYEQIEQPKEHNKPNMDLVKKIMEEFVNGTLKDVCVSSQGSTPITDSSANSSCSGGVPETQQGHSVDQRNHDSAGSQGRTSSSESPGFLGSLWNKVSHIL